MRARALHRPPAVGGGTPRAWRAPPAGLGLGGFWTTTPARKQQCLPCKAGPEAKETSPKLCLCPKRQRASVRRTDRLMLGSLRGQRASFFQRLTWQLQSLTGTCQWPALVRTQLCSTYRTVSALEVLCFASALKASRTWSSRAPMKHQAERSKHSHRGRQSSWGTDDGRPCSDDRIQNDCFGESSLGVLVGHAPLRGPGGPPLACAPPQPSLRTAAQWPSQELHVPGTGPAALWWPHGAHSHPNQRSPCPWPAISSCAFPWKPGTLPRLQPDPPPGLRASIQPERAPRHGAAPQGSGPGHEVRSWLCPWAGPCCVLLSLPLL